MDRKEPLEKKPCRNCKSEIQTKLRRCPYCGILNPTVTIKEILITIIGVIAVMSIYTYFIY
jgi:RNA polymerase subunit RPABC4/transcription elongation factor Spt4